MNKLRVFLIILFAVFVGIFEGFAQDTDSITILKKSLTRNLKDTTRLNILIKLADHYKSSKSTIYLAQNYSEKAYDLIKVKKLKTPYQFSWIRAEILYTLGMPPKAAEEMKYVIAELEKTNKFQEYAMAKNDLANYLHYSGQFRLGIETYLENIKFAEVKNLKSIIPQAYLGIANIYNILKKSKEEKTYLNLFLKESKKENDYQLIARAYNRFGFYYSSIDSNFNASIQNYQYSLEIYKAQKDSLRIINSLNSIGWNYFLANQSDSSLYYYFQSIGYNSRNNLRGVANAYENIGNIYRDKKDYKNALYYYGLCMNYSLKSNDLYMLAWLNKDISDLYFALGDYKMAYQHFVNFKNFNDSLINTEYDRGLADARIKYETEAKEKELELLNLQLTQHEYLVYGFLGIITLLLIIGLLIFRQAKMNAKRKISEMNGKLSEITHANLRQQMNPHFIFNTLNSIQYYMYQHDKLATNNYLTKFSSLIRKILENSQLPFVSIKDEIEVIQLYLELETLRFKEKFSFKILIDEEIDTLTYKIPTMLIQPYVENAVCHGLINKDDNGMLTLQMSLNKEFIICKIEDNGIGRDAAMEIKKQKSIARNSLGIKITESRIDISNEIYGTRMKAIYTDLKNENNLASGTRVELYLPKMT